MRLLSVALLCTAALLRAGDYSLGPDSQPQSSAPKGVVTKYKLEPGRFYPGTPHDYSLYVPAQYDAAKPTPFMLFLDGSGFLSNSERVPVVLDNLIAKHDLPPLIGIFVNPGVLPAVSDGAQSRFERVFNTIHSAIAIPASCSKNSFPPLQRSSTSRRIRTTTRSAASARGQ